MKKYVTFTWGDEPQFEIKASVAFDPGVGADLHDPGTPSESEVEFTDIYRLDKPPGFMSDKFKRLVRIPVSHESFFEVMGPSVINDIEEYAVEKARNE